MPWMALTMILREDQTDNTANTNYNNLITHTHTQAVQLINKTDSEDEYEGFQWTLGLIWIN